MATKEEVFNKRVESGVENALKKCMGIKTGESVLILTDHQMGDIGGLFFKKSIELGAGGMIMDIPPAKVDGEEPLDQVAKAMKRVDVTLLITSKSYSHSKAREEATNSGTRIASMPGITDKSIARTLNVNYENIRKKARALIEVLKKNRTIRVQTEAGTDITFRFGGREIHGYNCGIYDKTGAWGNLPNGEVYFAPVEKEAEGTIVIDASMAEVGKIKEPITLEVKNGFVTKITGGKEADKLSTFIRPLGRNAYNIAELGIGLNEDAKITGKVLEDEKVLGTAHIALGTNITFGGTVRAQCHLDGVFKNPSIWADDTQIMDKGKFLIDFAKILRTAVIK
jgi:leucyl aminopeptidase (aminopeptidase T)